LFVGTNYPLKHHDNVNALVLIICLCGVDDKLHYTNGVRAALGQELALHGGHLLLRELSKVLRDARFIGTLSLHAAIHHNLDIREMSQALLTNTSSKVARETITFRHSSNLLIFIVLEQQAW
jgi:hypothetical protein